MKPTLLQTSSHTLKILAAIVWYTGVVVLLIKSTGLFIDAHHTGVQPVWTFFAVLSGIAVGWIKAKYIFGSVCKKNLKRIKSLKSPMIWQFYRKRFFIFLCLMILFGHYFSRLAQGDFQMLIGLAVLELSVATALGFSSRFFWNNDAESAKQYDH